jgi:hypothetical protein
MNERIKELKEQAMAWVPNMADPDTKIRVLNAEKFAELIVRECAEIADKAEPYKANDLIKQHFGVEL